MKRRALLAAALCGACAEPPAIGPTTVPSDTFDAVGPYVVTTAVRGDPVAVELLYCADPVCLGSPAMTPSALHALEMKAGGARTYRGAIPGQPAGTRIGFFVRAAGEGWVVTDPPSEDGGAGRLFGFAVARAAGACRVDTDCGPGEICAGMGTCRASVGTCRTDDDCPAGFRCEAARCLTRTRRCAAHVDCLLGEVCDRPGYICRPPLPCGEPECPAGRCDGTAGVCLPACAAAAECDPSETCAGGRCQRRDPCRSASDCLPGQTCDAGAQCRFKGGGLCQTCAADADCGDRRDLCLVPPGSRTGVCGIACEKVSACPAGSACRDGTDPPQCTPTAMCRP